MFEGFYKVFHLSFSIVRELLIVILSLYGNGSFMNELDWFEIFKLFVLDFVALKIVMTSRNGN